MAFSTDLIVAVLKIGFFVFAIGIFFLIIYFVLESLGFWRLLKHIIFTKSREKEEKILKDLKKHPDWEAYEKSKSTRSTPKERLKKQRTDLTKEFIKKGLRGNEIKEFLKNKGWLDPEIEEIKKVYKELKK